MPADDAWSIPALREHIDQRFADAEKHLTDIIERIDERHKTFEVQVAEAKKASNEWRGALQDRERNTISRIEFDTRTAAIEAKGEASNKVLEALLGALGQKVDEGFKSLGETRAGNVATKSARDDVQVRVLRALTAASIIFGIVMALIARR